MRKEIFGLFLLTIILFLIYCLVDLYRHSEIEYMENLLEASILIMFGRLSIWYEKRWRDKKDS